jgi:hypothetical protein
MRGDYDGLMRLAQNGNQYAAREIVYAVKRHIADIHSLDAIDPKYLQKVGNNLGADVLTILQLPPRSR